MAFLKITAKLLRNLGFKELGWNISHASGAWDAKQRSGRLIDIIARLGNGGRIVEFGCGNGEIVNHLPEGSFSSYLGTDISPLAIRSCEKAHQHPNVAFAVADMASWAGETGAVQLILCEECIYYLTSNELKHFIHVCERSLTEAGCILLTIHSGTKFADLISQIKILGQLVDEVVQGERVYLVLGKRNTTTVAGAETPDGLSAAVPIVEAESHPCKSS